MVKYDFHTLLSFDDFENLICDVVSERESKTFRVYKEGRDGGIDGSFTLDNEKIIIQAKRYRQDFRALVRDLKHELIKLEKIKPTRYILGISLSLNPQQTGELVELFQEYHLHQNDIIDGVNLSKLLQEPKYKYIVHKYPKLWFPNINVLDEIIENTVNRGIYNESSMELELAFNAARLFVPTTTYHDALNQWTDKKVIILSGEPGVGKTTMAQILGLSFLLPNNLDGYIWVNSISDIYRSLKDDRKQVFILDDFWGSIFFNEQSNKKNEDALNKIINILRTKKNKRLILTTREYILQQGLQKHPMLKRTIDQYALTCLLDDYSEEERTKILFSHLYNSNLEYEYVDLLYYRTERIINHPNYNPRVIGIFLDQDLKDSISRWDYYEELIVYLDSPNDFWKAIFLELSEESQTLVLLLLTSSSILNEGLMISYEKYVNHNISEKQIKNFSECIKELEKTMIKTFYDEDLEDIVIRFSMPAVEDFLLDYLHENSSFWIPKILNYCAFYDQLLFLFENLTQSCSKTTYQLILDECVDKFIEYEDNLIKFERVWNDEIEMFDERYSILTRINRIINILKTQPNERFSTLIKKELVGYLSNLHNIPIYEQYIDLQNLPGLIVKSKGIGICFEGEYLIQRVYENSFSVYHYDAINKFKEVFPKEFNLFHDENYNTLRNKIELTIYNEVDFLLDFDMEMELEILIDDITSILKKYDLPKSKITKRLFSDFGIKVPKEPLEVKIQPNRSVPLEAESKGILNEIMYEAKDWLFESRDTFISEEEIIERVINSNLNIEVKKELVNILNSSDWGFIHDYLHNMDSSNLFLDALSNVDPSVLDNEIYTLTKVLAFISKDDNNLLFKLIGFCTETFPMIMHKSESVVRKNTFYESDVYNIYLKDDEDFHLLIKEYLIREGDQWIWFTNEYIYVFCFVTYISFHIEDDEKKEFYSYAFGDNHPLLKRTMINLSERHTNISRLEYGELCIINSSLESCLLRLFEEVIPYHFNEFYVAPQVEAYVSKVLVGDTKMKILNHVGNAELKLNYDNYGEFNGCSYSIPDAINTAEILNFCIGWSHMELPHLSDNRLQEFEQAGLAEYYNKTWTIYTDKINDLKSLKEIGIYEVALQTIKSMEEVHNRFVIRDYSPILKVDDNRSYKF